MKLKKLLKDIPVLDIKGSKEVEITGVCSHSKRVSPGNLFIARQGFSVNGADFIREAILAGASAIVTDIYDPFLKHVTQVIHKDVSSIVGALASSFYSDPSKRLWMVGITGTNGKTTTAYFIKHLLDNGSKKRPAGLIGTIEYLLGSQRYLATHTTPDVCLNQKMLKEMEVQGCHSAVMEVTSHALLQNRVQGISFDIALFTNLSQDHLDYHGSLEAYADAKSLLFKGLSKDSLAIVNGDDPFAKKMVSHTLAKVVTFGFSKDLDLYADEIYLDAQGVRCTLHYLGESVSLTSSLIGRHNLYNLLGGIAVALFSGISLQEAARLTSSFKNVPGRLERVANPLGLSIFVDFAHTPDALENVLQALSGITQGKVIVVFGCGGDRDRLKRPQMGRIAEKLADVVILTQDNPRNENPEKILEEIQQGFQEPKRHLIISDRAQAIEKAVSLASSEDVILIAGKGHEKEQILAHHTIAFDDRQVALKCCLKR